MGTAVKGLYTMLAFYASAYRRHYAIPVGDDAVIGAYWQQIAEGLIGLLNGHTDSVDCGKLDAAIRELARTHNIKLRN